MVVCSPFATPFAFAQAFMAACNVSSTRASPITRRGKWFATRETAALAMRGVRGAESLLPVRSHDQMGVVIDVKIHVRGTHRAVCNVVPLSSHSPTEPSTVLRHRMSALPSPLRSTASAMLHSRFAAPIGASGEKPPERFISHSATDPRWNCAKGCRERRRH
jgi:hypothetical protein